MGILDDFINAVRGQKKQYSAGQQQAEEDRARRENEARIKAAREQEAADAERQRATMEQARMENEAKIREAREREAAGKGRPSEYGMVGEVADRMKEQRRKFEEEQKKAAEAAKHPKPAEEKRGPIEEFEHRIKEQRRQFEEASKGPAPATKHAETRTVQEQKPNVITAYGKTFTHMPGQQPHVYFDDAAKAVYIDNVDEYRKDGGKVEQRDITAAMDPYMYDIYTGKGGPVGQARYYTAGGIVVSLVPDPFAKYR